MTLWFWQEGWLLVQSNQPVTLSPCHLVTFHVGADRTPAQAVLEESLQALLHQLRVAAAEAEAVALHGGHERVDGAELRGRRLRAGLAESRPGVDQVTVAGAFHDDGEALLAVGRRGGRARRLRRALRGQIQGRPEIEADL